MNRTISPYSANPLKSLAFGKPSEANYPAASKPNKFNLSMEAPEAGA
jgi:hypothetical protein